CPTSGLFAPRVEKKGPFLWVTRLEAGSTAAFTPDVPRRAAPETRSGHLLDHARPRPAWATGQVRRVGRLFVGDLTLGRRHVVSVRACRPCGHSLRTTECPGATPVPPPAAETGSSPLPASGAPFCHLGPSLRLHPLPPQTTP